MNQGSVWLFVLSGWFIGTADAFVNAAENCGEVQQSVARARELVYGSGLQLSPAEMEAVSEKCPVYSIYRLAGEYADYRFEWSIGDVRVVVFGRGDLSKLDGAQARKTKQSERK